MTTALAFVPDTVPDLGLVDGGRWRELGVTHWHMGSDDVNLSDTNFRFSAERWHGLAGARFTAQSADPVEVWRWLVEARLATLQRAGDPAAAARQAGWGSRELWLSACEHAWWMVTHLGYSSKSVLVSSGRGCDVFAEGMTPRTCSRH